MKVNNDKSWDYTAAQYQTVQGDGQYGNDDASVASHVSGRLTTLHVFTLSAIIHHAHHYWRVDIKKEIAVSEFCKESGFSSKT